jgi:hypothetical protein
VAGDFNNDGKLDLAVSAKGHISVLLGNGDGTFQSELTTLSVPTGPMVAADFDGDGNLDLALGPASNHFLYVRLGKGDGTFNLPKRYPVNEEAISLTYGDFNGDGVLDLAFGGGSGYTEVLLGKVGGTFGGAHVFNGNLYVAAGDFNNDGALDIGTNDGVFIATTVDVSTTSLDFGTQLVGSSSNPMTVTLKNEGLSSLAISSIVVTSNFAETNTCGSSLAPLAGCKISVTFDPLMLGQLNGTLTITDGAFGSPQTVSLTGTGAAPAVTLNPTSLTFGAQPVGTTSPPQYVMLTNTGDAALTIASIVASGDFAQTNSCGTTVLPGQDCTMIVTFTPTQKGTRTGAITITDNALDSPEMVPLTGTGD